MGSMVDMHIPSKGFLRLEPLSVIASGIASGVASGSAAEQPSAAARGMQKKKG